MVSLTFLFPAYNVKLIGTCYNYGEPHCAQRRAIAKMTNSIKLTVLNLSDDELQQMLKGDYFRKLSKYKLIDASFQEKYGVTFTEFERENVVAKKDFSWDVESDAQEWELAVDGIKTYQDKLNELSV